MLSGPSRRLAISRPRAASQRVVVTGIGLITSLGPDRESTWSAIRAGRTGARFVELPGLPPEPAFPARVSNESGSLPEEPVIALASKAAREALADAKFLSKGQGTRELPYPADRIATLVGLSKGGISGLGRVADMVRWGGEETALARLWRDLTWPDAAARQIAAEHGFEGPLLAPVAACATGLVAVLRGADLIREGACDVAIAGAADASLEPILVAAFRNMRALARRDDDPTRAVRPWDRNRGGFLVGEGAAILVLERADRAEGRSVPTYAEVAGGALGADAFHLTDLNPDPTSLAGTITRALAASGLAPNAIDHVNVHGTATRANDPLECRALRQAFGPHADSLSCSANKSQIGHLLGAAGAAELAITCLSLRDGFIPPTLNLSDPDPACDLDGTPLVGRSQSIHASVKLSIGFGGHLAAAVLLRT